MQVQTINLGIADIHAANGSMLNPPYRLFCHLDGLSPAMREQKRMTILKQLGLLETESIPVFDEATQTAARYLETPLCLLGMMVQDDFRLKSAVGLSRLGLMNPIASSRQISRQEAFSTYVVDSKQPLIIYDTLAESVFAQSMLVQHYGIRAYMGTPLITAEGQCIGAIAVMDLEPHCFSVKDLEFLNLTARWCLREFERQQLSKSMEQGEEMLLIHSSTPENDSKSYISSHYSGNSSEHLSHSLSYIKLKLLGQLTQELRTPLTAIIGMSSVLQGEVFGSLSTKQKEYLDIIHTSGQHLNSVVEEILKLGILEDQTPQIQLTPVNVEMLCQQSLNSLSQMAKQKRLQMRLSIEPGQRIWLLDKERVRQAIYYLVLSVIESSESGGDVRIHVSRRTQTLNIAIWISHPWLGDGLPQVLNYGTFKNEQAAYFTHHSEGNLHGNGNQVVTVAFLESALNGHISTNTPCPQSPQELLGLLLSCHLIESHGGKVMIQGSESSGYRYVLMLPKIAAEENG